MEKIMIMIILVNSEITIIQTIIFEFENMIYLFSILSQKHFVTENFRNFALKNTQNG